MNDGIKLSIFVVIIAVVAVIFVKPLNERLFHNDSKNSKSDTGSRSSKTPVLNNKTKGVSANENITYDIKKVQSLLRKAGFYKGKIDGKMGPQTIKAIKQFQKSRKLKESGVINAKTWEELKKYESRR